MQDERMSSKKYAAYEKQFMSFGSLMNAMQGQLTPKDWEKTANKIWDWCKKKNRELVDEMYKEEETPKKEWKSEQDSSTPF